MLGKLLKQEFRATGRLMLPAFGALVILSVLANISIWLLDRGNISNSVLAALLIFVSVAFGLSVFGIMLMTLVLMVIRFYRNLLKDEGYLMHTLPVTVHGLVWSKLIVSLVWFVVSGLVVTLILGLTVLIQSGTSLGELVAGLPKWEQVREFLASNGVNLSGLSTLFVLGIVFAAVLFFANCLHLYAAMAMGHMFNKDKVLLSVVFYVAISLVLNLLLNTAGLRLSSDYLFDTAFSMSYVRNLLLMGIGMELLQGALLYFATTLSLRRGLNLS